MNAVIIINYDADNNIIFLIAIITVLTLLVMTILALYNFPFIVFPPAVTQITCSPFQRQCFNSSVCLEENKFCDGRVDCPDGSDEGVGCVLTGCHEENGGCSQVCKHLPEGVYLGMHEFKSRLVTYCLPLAIRPLTAVCLLCA